MVKDGILYALAFGSAGTALTAWVAPAAGAPLFPLALFCLYFFRDPERAVPAGPVAVSPADGKVVAIRPVEGGARRISIFLNVFDVHVNRYPVDGTVAYLHYNEGKFINAAHDKASLDNEQMSVGIETGRHKVLTRQIAGLIARRIVTYSKTGEQVTQGARMGLIRFGSRVDVFVPVGSTPLVQVGDRATAGVTLLAELPE